MTGPASESTKTESVFEHKLESVTVTTYHPVVRLLMAGVTMLLFHK